MTDQAKCVEVVDATVQVPPLDAWIVWGYSSVHEQWVPLDYHYKKEDAERDVREYKGHIDGYDNARIIHIADRASPETE